MKKTLHERAVEEGQIKLVIAMLEDNFGSVPPQLRAQIERLSAVELRRLASKIGKAASLAELEIPTA